MVMHRSSNKSDMNEESPFYLNKLQFDINGYENNNHDYDIPDDFNIHWENTIGPKWDDSDLDTSSIVDDVRWGDDETETSKDGPGSDGIDSIMAHVIDANERADSVIGDCLPMDGSKRSMDDIMSLHLDEVLLRMEVDIDSAAVQPLHVSSC